MRKIFEIPNTFRQETILINQCCLKKGWGGQRIRKQCVLTNDFGLNREGEREGMDGRVLPTT